jgi:hypothetical protein
VCQFWSEANMFTQSEKDDQQNDGQAEGHADDGGGSEQLPLADPVLCERRMDGMVNDPWTLADHQLELRLLDGHVLHEREAEEQKHQEHVDEHCGCYGAGEQLETGAGDSQGTG